MPILYAIKHVISGKAYVGSTVNPRERHLAHLRMLRARKHHCSNLQRAWDKYGENQFVFIEIGTAESREDIRGLEQSFLDIFFHDSLYNAKQSAIGMPSGGSHPAKRDDWHLKKQMPLLSSEQRKARFGKHRGQKRNSPLYREAVLKQWADPEQKAKRSAAMRGKRKTVECPHCHLTGAGGNMRRYHFDNCKVKT